MNSSVNKVIILLWFQYIPHFCSSVQFPRNDGSLANWSLNCYMIGAVNAVFLLSGAGHVAGS